MPHRPAECVCMPWSSQTRWAGSQPLATAASKRTFQVVFFLVACFFAFRAGSSIVGQMRNGRFESSAVRFRVLETRGGGGPAQARIGGFGLLDQGCAIAGASSGALQDGQATLAFGAPVGADGYYFVTSAGDAAGDPVRWVLEAAPTAGNGSWEPVGAAVWAMTANLSLIHI